MSRSLIALFLVLSTQCLRATPLLPDHLGSFRKAGSTATAPREGKIFEEFGFVSSESASYRSPSAKGTVTAYQMKDATGAFAAWDWLRSSEAKRCHLTDRCAEQGDRTLIQDANYVL